jgi:serine/threonine protein kinase
MRHVSDVTLASESAFDTRPHQAAKRPAVAAPAILTPGERFDIQQVHAQGGLGVVFLARDHEIDRTVALKQIKSQWADDEDSRARFLLEARITGRLEHPGVVPIYALGADPTGRPYYAMRLIRGESLLEVLDRFHSPRGASADPRQRMPELRKLLRRFIDVCNAVDYAHSKGVIHRDVKPSNIMVGKYGETLVVDWGLAKVIGSDEDVALTTRMVRKPDAEGNLTSTQIGTTIGTPAYMSPEQAAGRNDELGPATDVYSLGATLYHLLTGALPHNIDDDVGVAFAKLERGGVTPPIVRAEWLPRPLSSICLKALELAPGKRYASARALADDVERWLNDEPVRAHRDSTLERAYRWVRNHRTLATSLLVGYLVAAAAVVVAVIAWHYR